MKILMKLFINRYEEEILRALKKEKKMHFIEAQR